VQAVIVRMLDLIWEDDDDDEVCDDDDDDDNDGDCDDDGGRVDWCKQSREQPLVQLHQT